MVDVPLPVVPGGYRTIIADPPWPYQQPLGRGSKNGEIARGGLPYVPMTLAQVRDLPDRQIAHPDAMLFLWTTTTHLPEAFSVLKAWGFEYKTAGAWTKVGESGKVQIGLGYWLRGAVEFFLLGVRGNPRSKLTGPHGATGLGVSNAILAPRREHSAKPERLYEIAEAMGEKPRIELFARGRRVGWDAWGDQVPSADGSPEGAPEGMAEEW